MFIYFFFYLMKMYYDKNIFKIKNQFSNNPLGLISFSKLEKKIY